MARKVGGGVDLWGVAIVNQQNGWRRRAAAKSPGVGQPLGGTNFGSAAAEEKKRVLAARTFVSNLRAISNWATAGASQQAALMNSQQQQQHVITCGSSSEQVHRQLVTLFHHTLAAASVRIQSPVSLYEDGRISCATASRHHHTTAQRTARGAGSWELGETVLVRAVLVHSHSAEAVAGGACTTLCPTPHRRASSRSWEASYCHPCS